MSRGFKKHSGRVAVVAELAETIRCDQAMLAEYEKRADPKWHAAKAHEIDLQIAALQARRLELDAQHAEAKAKAAEYVARIAKRRAELQLETNRKQVTAIKKLSEKIEQLRADPAMAEALEAMLRGEA